jgi:hypothetical protein
MNTDSYIEALKYQKERGETAKKEIALMPKGSPEQFSAQCDRLWIPYGIRLQELVDKHVNVNDPPEEKLQQLRIAVSAALEESIQGGKLNSIDFMMEIDHFMQRSNLTWETVEQRSVR